MSSYDKIINHDVSEPNAKRIAIAIILSGLVFGAFLWGSYLYYAATLSEELNRKESLTIYTDLQTLRVQESERLHSLKWVNPEKTALQIPIEMAMKNVVKHYSRP
ncbi:MAG: hypothetical protein EXS67_02700 [Candidatus Margulisbacteria bacterium]|nr:hypothetical protein [Candidatus Margulisiibacteriota bacterium]